MSPERAISEPVEQPDGSVRFAVEHRSELIRCRVTAEALWHLTGGRYRLPLQAFGALQSQLERVASAKYDTGLLDHDGGVSIDFADIAVAN